MRKIFLIALFALCAIEGFSQRYTPFQGWGFSARRLKADSVLLAPSDTVFNKEGIARIGSKFFVGDGSKWTLVQSGSIASDSALFSTKAYRQKGVDSVQANLTDGLSSKLNLSDSSLYASRGRLYKVADSLGSIIASATADSLVFSTKAYRQKGVDSVQANLTAGLALKLNLSDSSLYASRGRLYKVADSLGSVISSVSADSLVFSTKAYRQKGDDSVSALISPRITDSLRALVRLRASGSGGIDVQNSSGTSVANFGSGGSTNISLNGSTNVNARLTVTDSIVGVNQRLSGRLLGSSAIFNDSVRIRKLVASNVQYPAILDSNKNFYWKIKDSIYITDIAGASNSGIAGIHIAKIDNSQTNPTGLHWSVQNVPKWDIGLDFENNEFVLAYNHLSNFRGDFIRVAKNNRTIFGNGIGSPLYNQYKYTFTTSGNDSTGLGGINIITKSTSDTAIRLGGILSGKIGYYTGSVFSDDLLQGGTSTGKAQLRTYFNNSSIAQFVNSANATSPSLYGFMQRNDGANFVGGTSTEFNHSISATSITSTGALTANGKATFTDSILGVNQRLTGTLEMGSNLLITSGDYVSLSKNNPTFTRIYRQPGVGLQLETNSYKATLNDNGRFDFPLSVSIPNGALTATAQGNNIAVSVDSSVTSTSYTLVLGDAGYLKRCDNASTITITVPNNSSVAFPIGTTIYFSQKGAGKVTLSPASGVNLRSEGNLLGTAGQNAVIGIIKVNTNDFLVVGNRG